MADVIHTRKCWPEYYQAIVDGRKRFEARPDVHSELNVGDTLILCEWSNTSKQYTGRESAWLITFALRGPGFGIEKDHVILSISDGDPSVLEELDWCGYCNERIVGGSHCEKCCKPLYIEEDLYEENDGGVTR